MVIYIPYEQAIDIHQLTVDKSGGGTYSSLNLGYLSSVLDHIQNDDWYPTFENKLTHLI